MQLVIPMYQLERLGARRPNTRNRMTVLTAGFKRPIDLARRSQRLLRLTPSHGASYVQTGHFTRNTVLTKQLAPAHQQSDDDQVERAHDGT